MSSFLLDDSADDLNESYLGDSPGELLFGSLFPPLFGNVYLASIKL